MAHYTRSHMSRDVPSGTPPPSPKHPLLYDEYAAVTQAYKSKYGPDTVVLMEVGSFLEFYDCDRGLGADVPRVCATLGVQVTRKNKTIAQVSRSNPAFGGVPRVAMAKYVPMLVDAGFSVVMYMQQLQQQQQQQQDEREPKAAGGGNLKRVVTEVISRATLGATASLDSVGTAHVSSQSSSQHQNKNATLMAAHIERGDGWSVVGWALVDLSTGRTSAGECASQPGDLLRPLDALRRIANDASPVESVFGFVGTEEGTGFSLADVCAHLGLARSTVRDAGRPHTTPAYQNAVLFRAFPRTGFLTPAEFCDLERKPFALSALVMATQFAYEHSESIVARIQPPSCDAAEDDDDVAGAMTIDLSADAMQQLDVVEHGHGHGSSKASERRPGGGDSGSAASSLVRLLNRCRTPPGRRAFRDRLLAPSRRIATITARLDAIDAMRALDANVSAVIRSDLDRVGDLERAFRRVCLRRSTALDIASLVDQLEGAAAALRATLSAPGGQHASAAEAAEATQRAIESRIDVGKITNSNSSNSNSSNSSNDTAHSSFFVRGAHRSVDGAQDELDSARAVFHAAAAALNAEIKSDHVKVEYGD